MRADLAARVQARRGELEDVILDRICDAAEGSLGTDDPEYLAGLRAAIAAAVEHGLRAIEYGHDAVASIPPEAVAQTRRAARWGVSLEVVIRRYVLGSGVLSDFLMQEAAASDFVGQGQTLRDMVAAQSAVLEHLTEAISEEYALELKRISRSPEQRRAEDVRRLLAGERCDPARLGYPLEDWHLALIATGRQATQALRELACDFGVRLLCVASPSGESTWGWLGNRSALTTREVQRALSSKTDGEATRLVLGEPARGIEGWRLSHRQAQAALQVAMFCPDPLIRYADVALLASMLRDELLARSLIEIYLAPLGEHTSEGGVLRNTLREYFAAGRNAASAASALGVARHTVAKRLRFIEQKLGHTLHTRQAELEVALRLEQLMENGTKIIG